jgi:hypothetical protein
MAVMASTIAASGTANFSVRKREEFTFWCSFVSLGTTPGRFDVEKML